jgi:hypothetical protein
MNVADIPCRDSEDTVFDWEKRRVNGQFINEDIDDILPSVLQAIYFMIRTQKRKAIWRLTINIIDASPPPIHKKQTQLADGRSFFYLQFHENMFAVCISIL